jgi:hypothetical protein
MGHVLAVSLSLIAVVMNIPGMLEGKTESVIAGIFCSVCFGVTFILTLITNKIM